MGVKGTFESYAAAEAKSMNKMDLTGIGEFLDGSDGKTVWSINPVQGSREKTGLELAQARLTNNFYREINLDKLYPKMELKGIEKVGGKDTYVIVATADGLPPTTWYFDVIGGLLLRTDSVSINPEGSQASKVFIDEFRTIDGVTIPTKVRAQMPTAEIIMTVTEIKHGVSIEDAKFAKPKQ
jgi:zinc protease